MCENGEVENPNETVHDEILQSEITLKVDTTTRFVVRVAGSHWLHLAEFSHLQSNKISGIFHRSTTNATALMPNLLRVCVAHRVANDKLQSYFLCSLYIGYYYVPVVPSNNIRGRNSYDYFAIIIKAEYWFVHNIQNQSMNI